MAKIKTEAARNGLPVFVLTTLFILTTFFAKADVEYSTPLHGKEFKMGNRIEWKTAYEMDTKMFIVEKSDDGINFYMEREIRLSEAVKTFWKAALLDAYWEKPGTDLVHHQEGLEWLNKHTNGEMFAR